MEVSVAGVAGSDPRSRDPEAEPAGAQYEAPRGDAFDPAAALSRITHSAVQIEEGAPELGRVLSELLTGGGTSAGASPDGTSAREGSALEILAQHLPICVWEVDEDLTMRRCFGRAMRRLGLRDGALDGTPVSAWGSEGEERVRRALAGETVEFESMGVFDGLDWSMTTVVAPRPGGGAVAVSVDTTERYMAERQLAESESRLRTLAESAPIGIFLADPSGANVYANPELQRQFGLSADQMLGMHWLEAVHPEDRELIRAWRQGAHRPGERYDVQYRVIHPTQGERWLRVKAQRVYDGDDNHVGYVGSSEDVTERRQDELLLAAREERFRTIAESAPIGMFLSDTPRDVTYTNPKFAEILGRSGEQLRAEAWLEAVHPDDRQQVQQAVGLLLEGKNLDLQCRVVRPDGQVRWVHANAAPLQETDPRPGFVGTVTDITEFRLAEERIRDNEELSRAVLETAAEGIVAVDEEGRVMTFNAAAERITGWPQSDIRGRRFGDLLPDPHREVYLGYFRLWQERGEVNLSGSPPREVPMLRRDGSTVPVELAITRVDTARGTFFTGLFRDISERKEFERQLEHQATHDPLTSLPNRALLAAQLESALARAYRNQTSVAVLFVSLDRVKVVTDSLGHRAGDELRVAAAHRLQGLVRPIDTVTRFGEDEFVVLAEDLHDLPDAVEIAERIIEAMDVPFDLTVDEAFVTCNVGIAFAVDGLGTAESLIADADLAMFRARERGGGKYEIFDSEMRAWINERRKIEVALRHALERSEFELHYQPIVSVKSGELKGFEALVRWDRGIFGMASPAEFIPVAEESGLIVPIGEWILSEACRQAATWQREHDENLSVSVNLSGRQLAQRNIADVVARSLAEAGADPSRLVLEITETVLLDDVEQAVRTLDALKEIGVSLSIDDFGTGYSSLTYLRRFPIDFLKIDRSFVSKLGTDSRDASIVRTVILLAEGLDLDVVAEGVETREQLDALAEMNCGYAQGYYFSRPQPSDELGRFFS